MTTTIPDVGVGEATIEHLDFEFNPPCESTHQSSDNRVCGGFAVWGCKLPCGCLTLVCDPVRTRFFRKAVETPFSIAICGQCNARDTWIEWDNHSTWTRIKEA